MPYKDPEKQKAYIRNHYKRRRQFVIDAKSKPCADCGVQYPYYVMEFDHVRGDKVGNVNNLRWSKGIAKIAEEIAKCEVVCANCHRQRTHDRQAPLSQSAEESGLNPLKSGFESPEGY